MPQEINNIYNIMKLEVNLNSEYKDFQTTYVPDGLNRKQISKILSDRYGKKGWYSYDIK